MGDWGENDDDLLRFLRFLDRGYKSDLCTLFVHRIVGEF